MYTALGASAGLMFGECCHQLPVAGEHDAVVVRSELGGQIMCFKNAATLSAVPVENEPESETLRIVSLHGKRERALAAIGTLRREQRLW